MNIAVCLLILSCIILNTILVESATDTYHLGQNTATVTTGQHACCSGHTTDVTYTVTAVLNQKSTVRTNFGSAFDRRMTELGKLPGDQKGHILASVFGGPAQTWNLAPQADNVNKRLNDKNSILVGWYECENWILTELKSHKHLPVLVTMTLTYEAGNCRPTHWSIEAKNSDPKNPGCQALNIKNGFGGSFTACKQKTPKPG